MPPAAVLIASRDLLSALEQRAAPDGGALSFSDAQPLDALEAITRHHPPLIVLERFFAATPRGAALINRIKADPACAHAELRVMSHTGDYARVIQAGTTEGSAGAGSRGPVPEAVAAPEATTPTAPTSASVPTEPTAPAHLDWRGTRRFPRVRLRDGVVAQVDGKDATIIDLSAGGAQIVSAATLRPNQRLRISLPLEPDARLRATVAWASFELTRNGPRYRAGIEFNDDDPRIGPFAQKNAIG